MKPPRLLLATGGLLVWCCTSLHGAQPAPRAAASAPGEPVPAHLVQWAAADGGNGHYYQAVAAPAGIRWDDAQVWAVTHGGFLATIGSAAENNLVFHLVDAPQFWRQVVTPAGKTVQSGPWLGGFRPPNAPGPGQGWQWFDRDEKFGFTHWAGRQPDNENGNEDRLQFFSWDSTASTSAWNDQPGDAPERGFVVEYVSAALAPAGVGKTPPPPRLPPEFEPGPVVPWSASGGNGHHYQATVAPNGVSWADAHAWALAHGGYLATIGSAAENEFVFKLADNARFWADDPSGGSQGPLLGGRQRPGTAGPNGVWEWVNDDGPLAYARWTPGPPAGGTGDDRMGYFASGPGRRQPTWGGVNSRSHLARSFVVEYVSASRAPAANPKTLSSALRPLEPAAVYHWAVLDGGNGHYYQAVAARGGITWDAAQAIATQHGGYLATIGSAAENSFVFHLIDDRRFWNNDGSQAVGPFIGGFKSPDSRRADEGWQWAHGEGAFTYTNWGPGKPNNANGNEDRAHYYALGRANAQEPFWNDQPASEDEWGFVVEFDTKPAP